MDKETVVLGAHAFLAVCLAGFGAYRITLGQVVPGALNVAVAALVTGVGVYVTRLA